MSDITALYGRRLDHLSVRGLSAACRSNAKVLGFNYSATGQINAEPERLCKKCLNILGATVEVNGDSN